MKKLFLILLLSFCALGLTLSPRVDYSQSKYMKVAASTTDTSGGVVIPDGQKISLLNVVASGSDPVGYVTLVYCHGDETKEKIFASTKGDINIKFDTTLAMNQVTGDGTCELVLIITNDDTAQTPTVGGTWTAINIP